MYVTSLISFFLRLFHRLSYVLTALVYILIVFLSLIPSGVKTVQNYDKLEHLVAYLCLSFLCSYSFTHKKLFIVANMLLGILIELAQSRIPGRDMSGWDMLANAIGIFSGYLIYLLIKKITREKQSD